MFEQQPMIQSQMRCATQNGQHRIGIQKNLGTILWLQLFSELYKFSPNPQTPTPYSYSLATKHCASKTKTNRHCTKETKLDNELHLCTRKRTFFFQKYPFPE
jgi:hypothetical protein